MASKPFSIGLFWDSSDSIPSRIKRFLTAHKTAARAGVVVLGAEEFAELEACQKTPRKPTPSIMAGAEQLRRLYKNP